jgi:hypothetical protein
MAKWKTLQGLTDEAGLLRFRAFAIVVGLTALAAGPVMAVAAVVPQPIVLPVLSLGALCVAGVTALTAYLRRARGRREHVALWDIACAFTLVGCAAAMLSKPIHVAQLFGVATPQ